jgi:hypothetical protein
MWKWIRHILNLLFVIVVVAAVVIGWEMEDKDPESFFPGFFDSPKAEQSAPAPQQPAAPKAP